MTDPALQKTCPRGAVVSDDEHGTHDHSAVDHASTDHGGRGSTTWATAARATLHCLTGCATGEVLGMVTGAALGLPAVATVVLSIALAFAFGYALTVRGARRAGLDLRAALGVALAADTTSIAVMEVVDNTAVLAVPGALNAGLGSWSFWASLAGSLVLAFLVTTPVNRAMISRGKGHAVVHAHHP
jgi:hypothetical protein